MSIKKQSLKEETVTTGPAQTEELSTTFLTSLISEGWDRVGTIKEQILTIQNEFKGYERVITALQGLMDSYLVCIGQIEAVLDDESGIASADTDDDFENAAAPIVKVVDKEDRADALTSKVAGADSQVAKDAPLVRVRTTEPAEQFEYFVDFDEPVGSPLTDEDIY